MEVYDNQFLRDLTSGYTAGSGTLSVSAAAPVSVQGGTFRVRLANSSNTLLKVTGGANTTTWTVVAEANDANCAAAANAVLGCEITAAGVKAIIGQQLFGIPNLVLPPAIATFTWFNQGTASATALSPAGILLSTTATSTNVFGMYQAKPGAHYYAQATFLTQLFNDANSDAGLVVLGSSVTGSGYYMRLWTNGGASIGLQIFLGNLPFPFTTDKFDAGAIFPVPWVFTVRFENDGTNYHWKFSYDGGMSFQTITSWAVGADFTDENVGFGYRAGKVANAMTLIGWDCGTLP